MDIQINEEITPIMALGALAFIIVLSITYGAAAFMYIGIGTGNETEGLANFNLTHLFAIALLSIVLIMLIIIGLRILKKNTA